MNRNGGRIGNSAALLFAFLLSLSTAAHAERYTIPWFVNAGVGGAPQGVLRILNGTDESGDVEIVAIDDVGARTGPVTLELTPWAAVEITASELRSGNAAKGLASGLGNTAGDVRLLIDSDIAIVPSAYVRSSGGAQAAVHDTVLEERNAGTDTYRYDVAIFHPAANAAQLSHLRLINSGDEVARIMIEARDDTGMAASGGTVELTLPGGAARTLTAKQMEAGNSALFTGRLGAGVGNWRLSVTSDRPIQAVNVTVDSGGDWSNLSTTAVTGWAPENEAAFEARFLDRVIVSRDGLDRLELRVLADNRFRDTGLEEGVRTSEEGEYEFERTGRDAGLLTLRYDSRQPCASNLYFDSPISGWYASGCVDSADAVENWTGGGWWTLDAGAAPLDLGSGLEDLAYTVGASIDALTLPAATGGGGGLTYSLSPEVPGLSFDPATRELSGTPSEAGAWLMTYRVRDASGDSDWRYFNIAVETATGGGETTHEVGDTLSDLPTGSWIPDVTSGASFSSSAGNTTVNLNEGGYIEEGGHRYSCQSAGGCVVENRRVTSGTVVQTASGTAPGGGITGDHGDVRASAVDVAPGSDTQGDLTSGDVDYFRVVVNTAGTLEAYTTGRTDTLGWLEDADGAVLGRNDDGGAGTNFQISEDITPGTYYVRVAGYSSRVTGDYTLHVRFTESSADTSPSFAAGAGPGDQTYTVGTAISALTLPEASGGDGPLTYSLTPAVPGLSFNATASVRRLTGTPSTAGTYDMTYRVRDADGDTDSITFAISVENAGGSGGVAGDFGLDEDNGVPSGVAFANSRFYVVDGSRGRTGQKVYAYTASGQRDSAADFDLISNNYEPEGIAFANGRFYVVDGSYGRVYAYTASGQRDSAADFGMAVNYSNPKGIAFANGRLYVVSERYGKVYAYTASGQRDSAVDFDLDGNNSNPGGIAFADGRFYVVDLSDEKVYAYTTAGQRDSASDLFLDVDTVPSGIISADDNIYVLNRGGSGRDGNVYLIAPAQSPDLVVESPSVSNATPGSDGTFVFSAIVRNRGPAASDATTLRYYRSDDRAISTSDTQVGTGELNALSAAGTSSEEIALAAPTTPGTHFYGVCVEPVEGEFYVGSNCSRSVTVYGDGPIPEYDLELEILESYLGATFVGDALEMDIRVTNHGPNASRPAKLWSSEISAYRADIPALGTHESETFYRVRVARASRGTTTIRVCVVNADGEENGDNNCGTRTVTFR